MKFSPVAINRAYNYDEKLYPLILSQLRAIGVCPEMLAGKRVAVKPNLVMSKSPEYGATTHPLFLSAVISALRELGASDIIVAESSGGPYTEATIRAHYKNCGITDACGAPLNYSTAAEAVMYTEGITCKRFNIIKPIVDADVVVNVCKLKTHQLTKLTCAVKNLFGVIPGIEKFEMHAAYSRHEDFRSMLFDLDGCIMKNKTLISVCDGILGMEGNGPTGGSPRAYNAVISSMSPYCLDLAAEKILGFEGTCPTVRLGAERGLNPATAEELQLIGDDINEMRIPDVVAPDSERKTFLSQLPDLFGGRLANFFRPRPVVNTKKCVGCGECVRSCPKHTIEFVVKNGKKKAKIKHSECILCYCCQELCPFVAIDVKKNLIVRIAH